MKLQTESYRKVLDRLYPTYEKPAPKDYKPVDYHLLGLLFVLAVRGDLLAEVFPADGERLYDMNALKNIPGLDVSRVEEKHIRELVCYREAFAAVWRAWAHMSPYENPPCPDNAKVEKVLKLTQTL